MNDHDGAVPSGHLFSLFFIPAIIGVATAYALVDLGAKREADAALNPKPRTTIKLDTLAIAGDNKPVRSWVTVDRLNRRTCPSVRCGIVGQALFRDKKVVFETRDGWARVSNYHDASCVDGKSTFVDNGNANCTADNGIVDGGFAEWVSDKFLSRERPPRPDAGVPSFELLVSKSDDYRSYRDIFVNAADRLMQSGLCTSADFVKNEGWVKSMKINYQPVYFVYCKDLNTSGGKIYFNTITGKFYH